LALFILNINKIHTHNSPLVSVVVTTKDEERNIDLCLQSILLQTYKSIEIIVVDNYSTDRTCEISKSYDVKVLLKGPERSAQRNFGMINIATGKYVLYLDADMIISPLLIEECVSYLETHQVSALHIKELVLGANFFGKVRRFEREFYDGTVIDGARIFLRKDFIRAGGFDESIFKAGSGEDWDIDKSLKLFGQIHLLPHQASKRILDWHLSDFINSKGVRYQPNLAVIYHNESEFILADYLKKKLYYTKGFDGYIKKWGKDDPDVCMQFSPIYRFFGVFTEQQKWKLLIGNIPLSIGVFFLRFLVGIIFIYSKIQKKLPFKNTCESLHTPRT
jgi:glycosyltransferase involved in cell wall biosynthesis